jgi:hypothetical protein
MRRVLVGLAATALVAAGCAVRSGQDPDPFRPGDTPINFTHECVAKDANGGCLKYTCKQDSTSDCSGFANGCVKGGNHYSGTAEGGSCSKVL